MIDSNEFRAAIEKTHDEEDPKEPTGKVSSLFLYYSARRHLEVPQAEAQDTALDGSEDVDMKLPDPTKRHAE